MSDKRVRVRFAPSPTGPLHMGGVRTALYNYLFAKKMGGDFILRIEDTDQGRFVPGAEEYIIESLRWCGIEPNEGLGFGDGTFAPYRQSERKPMYRQYAEQLVEKGYAYLAFDTQDEMETLRRNAESKKETFAYDSHVRGTLQNSLALGKQETDRRLAAGEAYVIRLKVPPGEEIVFTDLIRGEVRFNSDTVDDKVLLKSDGMPTYHLAHIVDDYLMLITHAIRGEEWLPSAPAHILIYRYLGWQEAMPHYAHLPLLLKPDGNGKLSKRDGDRLGFPVFPMDWLDPATGEKSSGYRERGYYPDAFINMLAFLGWNPGTEQELFSINELVEAFSFEHIHKAGARFDPEKAKWFNEQYVRMQPEAALADVLRIGVKENFHMPDDDVRLAQAYLEQAAALLKPRVQFANELAQAGPYLFHAPEGYDQSVITKKWKPACDGFFRSLSDAFSGLEPFTSDTAKEMLETTATAHGLKPGDVLQLFRVMLSGQATGIDLFGMVSLLGKTEVVNRIGAALKVIHP